MGRQVGAERQGCPSLPPLCSTCRTFRSSSLWLSRPTCIRKCSDNSLWTAAADCAIATKKKEEAMSFDVLIKNARICDGTGAPTFHGAVAINEGKIAEVGNVSGSARREIDAEGLVLAPGFVDHHTHYDAQISWDPLL